MPEKASEIRVAHFSHSPSGGAGIAARRIHEGLLAAGVKSIFYHGSSDARYANGQYRSFGKAQKPGSVAWFIDKVRRYPKWRSLQLALKGRPEGLEAFSPAWQGGPTPFDPDACGFDVIHLHMVTELIDTRSFFACIPAGFPIIWTLHDMSAFTGGCHYAGECRGFEGRCGNCPQLGKPGGRDLSARGMEIKIEALAGKKNLHVAADSRWLEGEAKKSAALAGAKSFRTVYYGLDTGIFCPRDKRACREALKVPQDAAVVCFGAESVTNRRKGLGELMQALAALNRQGLVALVFGGGNIPGELGEACRIIRLGFVESMDLQATVYSAADFFVIPSLQEAFGQTALESMSCGRPVVGFDVGGIPEFVTAETGLLAAKGDVKQLAEKIAWMIDNPARRDELGQAARKSVEAKFTSARQAEDYVALYREATGR